MEVRFARWAMFLDPGIKKPFLILSVSNECATVLILIKILYRYHSEGMTLL